VEDESPRLGYRRKRVKSQIGKLCRLAFAQPALKVPGPVCSPNFLSGEDPESCRKVFRFLSASRKGSNDGDSPQGETSLPAASAAGPHAADANSPAGDTTAQSRHGFDGCAALRANDPTGPNDRRLTPPAGICRPPVWNRQQPGGQNAKKKGLAFDQPALKAPGPFCSSRVGPDESRCVRRQRGHLTTDDTKGTDIMSASFLSVFIREICGPLSTPSTDSDTVFRCEHLCRKLLVRFRCTLVPYRQSGLPSKRHLFCRGDRSVSYNGERRSLTPVRSRRFACVGARAALGAAS